ncbi:UNVERIFIED_CONTAM: hypothetical protein Slati_3959800 [Sesamum latifolium]|uniref:RNase H type-1 domain-containing protein n=1 Tax=Sesamum latifolium TaxID=2727402 RepID=A0AAW2TPS8_9LAMI
MATDEVVLFARRHLEAFNRQVSSSQRPSPPSPSPRWSRPAIGSIKINFDGASLENGLAIGIGTIARKSDGTVCAWLAHRLPRQAPPEMVEALAARESILLALRRRWRSVTIEGDCAHLISRINSSDADLSPIGLIVHDISPLLVLSIQFVFLM